MLRSSSQTSKGRYCSILLLCVASAVSLTELRAEHANRAKHLDDVIEQVTLTDGMQTIGGASIDDAVNLLRDKTAFPVALEMVEFDRPKDFVTLDEALGQLHKMHSLNERDKQRLRTYEELAKTHPGSEVVVPRQKTFTLTRERITVRDLLDQIAQADDEYEWKNYGSEKKPVIVVQPRAASALNWNVAPICKTRHISIDQLLAGCKDQPCGPLTQALSDHQISVMDLYEGTDIHEDNSPHGFLDMCAENLTARDALNLIEKSAHTSWTLGGIKGMRFLSFGPVRK